MERIYDLIVQADADMKPQLENLLYFVIKTMNGFVVFLVTLNYLEDLHTGVARGKSVRCPRRESRLIQVTCCWHDCFVAPLRYWKLW